MTTPHSEAVRKVVTAPAKQARSGPIWNPGPGSQVSLLIGGPQSQGNLVILEQTMLRGSGVPLHINHREDEFFYVTEGTYRFEVDSKLTELGAESYVFVPKGIPHRFMCVHDGKMIIVCQPAGIESAFEEADRLPKPIDAKTFGAVAQKYGIEVLGPPLTLS